jgi:hypothetical protein
MTAEIEGWNFTVVGCDSSNLPKYLGVTETREEAETLQKNMEKAGWRRVAIIDADHQEQIQSLQKELAQKDEQLAHLEDLLKRQQGLGLGRG